MRVYSHKTGSVIKKARLAKGMTQKALSIQMGWKVQNTQTVSNLERGVAPMPPKYVDRLSFVLGVPEYEISNAMVEDYSNALTKEMNKLRNKII